MQGLILTLHQLYEGYNIGPKSGDFTPRDNRTVVKYQFIFCMSQGHSGGSEDGPC